MEKIALVVGASRGLGLGLARELHGRDWRVVATARKPAQAPQLQALAAQAEGRVEIETIDVDVSQDIDALARRLSGRRLDLLILNAGISGATGHSALNASPEELAQILWTNSIAPVRIAQRFLPQIENGGTVAFMSSVLGSIAENTFGGHDLYRVSKVALNMLTRSFSVTGARDRGVAVLCLHPGWVRTDMGGPEAPLETDVSVRGLVDVLEAKHDPTHRFLDYTGREIPW